MPRRAREQSPTQYYHVMMRGINKERIFESEKHKAFLIRLLLQEIEEIDVKIGAYCVMDNHVHIVIKGELNNISKFFKKINIKFAMKYNKDLDRVGHVFQDRYKSEIILNDNHLTQAIRYVHKNPVKAGMVSGIEKYKWSSYKEYLYKENHIILTEIKSLVLDLLGDKKGLERFHSKDESILFLDTEEEVENVKHDIVNNIIKEYCSDNGIMEVWQIKDNPESMDNVIKALLKHGQFTHREIATILEINRNLVHMANNKDKTNSQKEPSPLPLTMEN